MLPEILGLNLYTATTALGYAVGTGIGLWLGLKDGRHLRDLLELAVVIVISGVLGAKVFHTLFEAKGHVLPDGRIAEGLFDLFAADPWHWARLFESGYVYYGGVLFGIGMAYVYLKRGDFERIGAFGDYAAPGFALGIFIGRLGCYTAGCCYGSPTQVPWAVTFGGGHPSGGVPIHPVQLYDAAFGLLSFVLVLAFSRRRRFDGETFALLIAAYSVWRFGTELFRADADRGLWLSGALSTSQLVSLLVLPVTLALWWRGHQQARANSVARAEIA